MAWLAFDLDETLVNEMPDEMSGETVPTAVEGAPEALQQLAAEGHRITVYTSRFAPMPDAARNRLKQQIEGELAELGFPEIEVWTGTTRPSADFFIGANHITFDNDWGLALAQLQVMMEDRGLVPGPQPDDGMYEPEEGDEEAE